MCNSNSNQPFSSSVVHSFSVCNFIRFYFFDGSLALSTLLKKNSHFICMWCWCLLLLFRLLVVNVFLPVVVVDDDFFLFARSFHLCVHIFFASALISVRRIVVASPLSPSHHHHDHCHRQNQCVCVFIRRSFFSLYSAQLELELVQSLCTITHRHKKARDWRNCKNRLIAVTISTVFEKRPSFFRQSIRFSLEIGCSRCRKILNRILLIIFIDSARKI